MDLHGLEEKSGDLEIKIKQILVDDLIDWISWYILYIMRFNQLFEFFFVSLKGSSERVRLWIETIKIEWKSTGVFSYNAG